MNNTALITGASGGIGKSLAEIHAKIGGDLVLVARSEDKLQTIKQDLEQQYNIAVEIITMDLSAIDSGTRLYEIIQSKNIQIDILINNAGFGGQGYFHKRNWSDDKQMIQLNILTLCELTRLFSADMVERKSGKILNVSSTASFLPGPLQATYFATKAYVQSFSNAIAKELEHTGVTVTNLMPGPVATGFEAAANLENTTLLKGAVTPEKVAQDGYNAMIRGKRDVISGLSLWRRLLFIFLPFTPKSIILHEAMKLHIKK